jgi:alkylhydroperoxidase family enzyme
VSNDLRARHSDTLARAAKRRRAIRNASAAAAPIAIAAATPPKVSVNATCVNQGMDTDQFAELMAVVGLANETNRLANGYDVPVDDAFS